MLMSLCISVCIVPIVLFVCHHCNVWTYNVFLQLFTCLCLLFLSSRTKYSPFSLEQLLSACNVFSSSVASNARGRLCRLGEDLVQPVIQVWIKSSQTLKVRKRKGGEGGREGGREGMEGWREGEKGWRGGRKRREGREGGKEGGEGRRGKGGREVM